MRGARHARSWRRSSPWALGGILGALALASPAVAIDGRYLGTYQETNGGDDFRAFEHRTDLEGRRLLAPGVDGLFGASLRYTTEPGVDNADLLRSRLFGEARGAAWRFHGQWLPWQDQAPGPTPPRQRELELGGDARLLGGANLAADWTRSDHDFVEGVSSSDSKRIQVAREWNDVRTSASWRRIETEPSAFSIAAPTRTTEWRGAAGWQRSSRTVSLSLDSDALMSRYTERERKRDFHAETVESEAGWRIGRRTSVGASGLFRTGATDDNALPSIQDLDERAVSLHAEHHPFQCLVFEGSREYRKRQDFNGDVHTDYFRLGTRFSREVVRATTLLSGYQHSVEVGGNGDEVPNNDAWVTLESRVRRGVVARADVRTQDPPAGDENRLWRYLGQVTLDPTPNTKLDVAWTRQVLPRIDGLAQHDGDWTFTGSWNPGRASLVSSLRVLRGVGRIDRSEKTWTLATSVPLPRGGDVHFDALHRDNESAGIASVENTWGVAMTAQLPQEARLMGAFRRTARTDRPRVLSGTVTLELKFGMGGRS